MLRHCLLALCCLLLAAAASAQPAAPPPAAPPATSSPPTPAVEPIVTHHRLDLPSGPLEYAAVAGRLTLNDDAGKPRAHFFFVAYHRTLADGASDADRPVTFVFNGGPGAAAVWLHLGVAGPKVIALEPDGSAPPPPARLVDNPHTWLDATDLVFIDPIGTGFSRAAEGVDAKEFYGAENDVRSVAEFIRLYLNKYDRWDSPKFLAGESYGTTRAAALASHLLDNPGVAVNGVVLISTVLDFATLSQGGAAGLPFALYVPSFTAAAHHHRRLPEDLQARPLDELLPEVERWAMTQYLTTITLGDRATDDERDRVAATLARYTAMPADLVEQAGLRVHPSLFMKELLREGRQIVGRFDARLTSYALEPVQHWPEYDPSLSAYLPLYSTAFNAYVRETLGYRSDLAYDVLSDRVRPWDFGKAGEGYLNVTDDLRAAMAKQPAMKLLIASGTYDLATPYFASDYTVDHLDLSEPLRKNITQTYYPAGHMMYHEQDSLRQLSADVTALIRSSVKAPATAPAAP